MTIPVMIVPILNRPDLLGKMLASIDYPVEQVIVIDNGGVVPDWTAPGMHIIRLPHNIGCGAAWNLGMQVTPTVRWWFIVNHDITFAPGDLERLANAVEPDKAALYHMLGFTSWAITPPALEAVGWLDPAFHPAYDEDVDYSRRCELAGVPRTQVENGVQHDGSSTIRSDPAFWLANGKTHPANDAYYAAKWGGHKDGGETFTTPFNRGGHVGDWRLEPSRLRNQAWPKATPE